MYSENKPGRQWTDTKTTGQRGSGESSPSLSSRSVSPVHHLRESATAASMPQHRVLGININFSAERAGSEYQTNLPYENWKRYVLGYSGWKCELVRA
ncbi:hypothetical protein KM043_016538 [Ampulex compressa]|nr:hypothetical protein KM043_016538 [Ampulex compressa]